MPNQYRTLTMLIALSGFALLVGSFAFAAVQDRQWQAKQPSAPDIGRLDSTAAPGPPVGLGQQAPTVRYVDPGLGVDTRLNMPDVSTAAASSDPATVRAVVAELVSDLEAEGLANHGAVLLQLPDGRFSGESRYGDATGRELVIVVWTPSAPVEWVALKDSPVRRFEQASLGAWPALVMLPTKDVIGSGPRDVLFATSNHVVWVHGEGFPDDDDFMAIAERLAQEAK
jgi:hypothetical protein